MLAGRSTPTTTLQPECICIELYSPVCADNGQTYSNDCKAGCAGVQVKCVGECPCDNTVLAHQADELSPCPSTQPKIGSTCTTTAVSECPYGEECCCGECSSSIVYTCMDSSWAAYATDFCVIESCESGRLRN